jgi:3-phosphoshikimate 1-carboxyvinyltransferase
MKIVPIDQFGGSTTVPGDKSVTHRAYLLSMLAEGESEIVGAGTGEDNRTTRDVIQYLGATVSEDKEGDVVTGVGMRGLKSPGEPIDCGNSGTTARLLVGLLAGAGVEATLIGDESLSIRPMRRVADPLNELGYHVETEEDGTMPLRVVPQQIELVADDSEEETDGGLGARAVLQIASAQVKSCILLSGLFRKNPTQVVEPAVSRDHTERLLRAYGARVESTGHYLRPNDYRDSENAPHVTLYPGTTLKGRRIEIPGDLSSAAFLLAAGLLVGEGITVENVGINPTRTGFLDALERMGADVQYKNRRVLTSNEPVADLHVAPQPLAAIDIRGGDIPLLIDEIPILCVLGAASSGRFRVRDAEELRVKESDRIATTSAILRGMGVEVEEFEDGLEFDGLGEAGWSGFEVDAALDHRIGMAGVVAALAASEPSSIKGSDAIAVSYPDFHEVMNRLGAEVSE